jgi:DNA (cytosine-5)-methyltransferase 1
MTQTSHVTVTDQFCGAGGSSLGASLAGAEIRLAMNHWKLAVETHNSNFPGTDHDCTDISAVDPRRYPPTDILITSPECTNHSLAKGKIRKWQSQLDMFGKLNLDPGEERSRATMWDVCRFAEAHHYKVIIVENVVEARHWAPFPAWLHAMELLGYNHQLVYLNSMFAHPTPQSRDRMYIVFWLRTLRRPNLDIRPTAHCPRCAHDVAAVQSWKNPMKPWGKYGQQYRYLCPDCAGQVSPYYFCAANAIDWSLPAPRIGDRSRPLKEKTLKRIQIGLDKFGRQAQLIGNYSPGWARPVSEPAGTVTSADHHALLTPPFTVDLSYTHSHGAHAKAIDDTTLTQTGRQTHALVVPPFLTSVNYFRPSHSIEEPYPTQTSGNQYGVVVPPYLVDLRGENAPRQMTDTLSTVCSSGNHHGMVVPPFLTSFYGTIQQSRMDQAVPTQTAVDRHALVVPPFIMSYYTRLTGQQAAVSPLDEALPTVPGRATHYLAQPGETPLIEDCGFRMLQPHEIGAAMAFPDNYIVLGNQREKVKQYGNAVTPPVMQLLIGRCLEVLG